MRKICRLSVALLLLIAFAASMLPAAFGAGELTATPPGSTPTFSAGTTSNKITVPLTNGGAAPISSISIDAPLIQGVTSNVSVSNISSIAAGETEDAIFTISIASSALKGPYTLAATVTYTVEGDADAQTLPVSLPFKVDARDLSCTVSGNSLSAGSSANLTLSLKNNTTGNYTDMVVDLEGLSSSGIASKGITSVFVGGLNSGENKSATFSISAASSVAAGYYDLTAQVIYKDGDGNAKTEEFSFFVAVSASSGPSGTGEGSIDIYSANINRQTVKSGDSFQLAVRLRNDGPSSIKNVKVAVAAESGLSNTSQPTVVVAKVSSESYYTVDFDYIVDEDIKTKFYSLNITLTYTEDGSEQKIEWPTGIYVKNPAAGEKEDLVSLSGVTFSKSEAKASDEFSATIIVRNDGKDPVYNLSVSASPDEGVVNKSQNILMIGTLEAGGSRTLNYTFLSRSTAPTSNYMINFSAAYQTESGKTDTAKTISQYGGIFIRNPELDKEDEDPSDGTKNKPVIIIDNYVIEPNIVHAGQEFDLTMTFQNTNPSKTVKNVKMFLTVNETTEESGTVFTPVGSSNTFYEDSIGPKGRVTRKLRFYTVPDAEQKTYTVVVNFEYEDADGNPYTGSEQVGIPVRQEARMQFGQLNGPEQIGFVGQQTYIAMDFYNTGRQTMYNLMVNFESDDFTSQNPIYYVGNFDPGTSDYYETSITPLNVGSMRGKIVFSFEDAAANPVTIEKEFSMEIQEMMVDPGMEGPFPGKPGMEEPEQPAGAMGFVRSHILWLVGGFVLLVVGLIIFFRIRKKRKQRQMNIEDDKAFGDTANGAQQKPEIIHEKTGESGLAKEAVPAGQAQPDSSAASGEEDGK